MENQPSNDPGVHPPVPPVPPTKPPDQGDHQNGEVSIEDSQVHHETMSEGSIEDEPPMAEALEEQPTTSKNGVSLPNSASNYVKGLERTEKPTNHGTANHGTCSCSTNGPFNGSGLYRSHLQCGPTRYHSEERQSRYHDNGPKRHAHTQTTRSSKLWPGPRIPQPQVLHQDPQALAPLVRDRTKNQTVTRLEHTKDKTRTPMRPPPYLASTYQAEKTTPKTTEE